MGSAFRFGSPYGAYTPPRQQPGFLTRDSYLGEEIDPALGLQARNRGLVGFGTALLAGAGSGDYGQTFARGIDAFANNQDETLQRGVAMERQRKADERAAEEAAMQRKLQDEQLLGAKQGRELREEDQSRQRTLWGREDQARKTKPEAALDLISSIESVAGVDSPEAKQARALARMGEDVDLAALDRLNREALDWSRKDDEYELKLKYGRIEDENQAKRGYGPIESARLDRERLELERRRLARAEANDGAGDGGISLAQARLAAKDDYDAKKANYVNNLKEWQERNKHKFALDPNDPRPKFDFDAELRKSKKLVEDAYGVRLPGSEENKGTLGETFVGKKGETKIAVRGTAIDLTDLKTKSKNREHARRRLAAGGFVGAEADEILTRAGW